MPEPPQFEPAVPAGAGDLSGLPQADQALLRSLLDATPARVIVLDANERLTYANDGFFAFSRLHPKQVLGKHVSEIIGKDTYSSYAPIREKLDRGETVRWEGWTELAGQGPRFMREHIVPCGIVAGQPRRATVVMSLDMTALKQREAELSAKVEELQNTEALKSSIVDHALAGLVSSDDEGRIVDFNPAAETMFGWPREEVLGLLVGEVIVPQRHRAAHHEGMRRMREGGLPRLLGRRVEMTALKRDGIEVPVEMVLWRSEVNGAAHYTASFTDLSERHRAVREIEQQREQLRQSEKLTAMGTLLAGVAHELNNPLAIVLGRAALLEDKTAEYPAMQADARRIREAAERCGRIVRTFLNMARQRPGERSAVQLNDLVRAAVDILGYTLRSHGVRIVMELDAELPTVHADGDQVGQIVLNLLVNAQQALATAAPEDQEVRLTSGLESRRDEAGERSGPGPRREPRVWLRVSDRGPGVREDLRARLFEPFFTTKPEGSGTGLGLAVSRSIAREHGGDLVLEPSSIGASFRLSLPPSGLRDAPSTSAMPLAPVAATNARVLVVDDEAEIADLLREMLEGAGYDVATAESGRVALAMLDEARFDAIVSDLHMPDIDGATLWREVQARDTALARRMLFVTGDTLSPSVRQFLERTRCEGLTKPFSKAALLARMTALLTAAHGA